LIIVTPAQAGVQGVTAAATRLWIPAFAGMTIRNGHFWVRDGAAFHDVPEARDLCRAGFSRVSRRDRWCQQSQSSCVLSPLTATSVRARDRPAALPYSRRNVRLQSVARLCEFPRWRCRSLSQARLRPGRSALPHRRNRPIGRSARHASLPPPEACGSRQRGSRQTSLRAATRTARTDKSDRREPSRSAAP